MLSERQKRIAVMRQFELQYPKYPIKILERLTNFRYRIFEENRQIEVLATVLASSWDFYEHRLNLAKHGFNLIICQKHNAAVPLLTLELDTQVMYGASAVPDRAPDRRAVRSDEGAKEEKEGKHKRRTPDERRILISQIIIGSTAGMGELANLSDRTQERYLKLRELYLQPKVGRPWAS